MQVAWLYFVRADKTLGWNKIMWHVIIKHWYIFILAKKKKICMCCTIISKYIIWKYCLTKWTDAILAKVSIHSPPSQFQTANHNKQSKTPTIKIKQYLSDMFNGVYAGLQQYQGSHQKSEKRSLTFVMGVEKINPAWKNLKKLHWKTSLKVTRPPPKKPNCVPRPCSAVI